MTPRAIPSCVEDLRQSSEDLDLLRPSGIAALTSVDYRPDQVRT